MKRWALAGVGLWVLGMGLGVLSSEQGKKSRLSPRTTTASAAAVLAPTPPMGWNSWDCYGTTVREEEVKANADYLATHLAGYGWQYVVVDIQWYEPQAKAHGYRENADLVMDEYGRLQPAPNRFPSAAQGKGFKPLADYVHGKGLKFGIHIMRGIPRLAVLLKLPVLGTQGFAKDIADPQSLCPWSTDMYGVDTSKPAGQAYYDSIGQLYVDWGVDYIKADDMTQPYHSGEIEALSNAIRKSRRPIVLSLSPGPTELAQADHLRAHAQLWRISDDFWDRWKDLKAQFALCRKWVDHIGPGHWPDADLLPLGRIGIRAEQGEDRQSLLTADEQVTLMTLWCIFRSPLMFGGDLPSSDASTLRLLTNSEVLAVNQHSTRNRELFTRGEGIAWCADVPATPAKYLAVFNLADQTEAEIKIGWKELNLQETCLVRDLWMNQDLETFTSGYTFHLRPHASGLVKISPTRGVTGQSSGWAPSGAQ